MMYIIDCTRFEYIKINFLYFARFAIFVYYPMKPVLLYNFQV